MVLPANLFGSTAGPRRGGRAQDAAITDPYKRPGKLPEPTVCPQCGAVFRHGRWTWAAPPAGAHAELCQACHRINDAFPAGEVVLSGSFVPAHRDEILALIRHQEMAERPEHPFNRIMGVSEAPDGITVTTTDIHLPRRIGEALERAFDGTLGLTYDEDGYFLRVRWARDG